jgi:hypothetical protein
MGKFRYPKFSKSPKATIAISKQIISVAFMLAGQEAQVQEKMGYSWHVFDRRGEVGSLRSRQQVASHSVPG